MSALCVEMRCQKLYVYDRLFEGSCVCMRRNALPKMSMNALHITVCMYA